MNAVFIFTRHYLQGAFTPIIIFMVHQSIYINIYLTNLERITHILGGLFFIPMLLNSYVNLLIVNVIFMKTE